MNATELVDYVKMLWPKWDATDEELRLWLQRFNHVGDLDVLQQAVQDHYAECKFLSPRLANILAKYHEAYNRANAPKQSTESQGTYSGYAVMCYGCPSRPKLVGHFQPLFRNAQGFPDAEHHLHRIADSYARACIEGREEKQGYGGDWRVCTHWTLTQLFDEGARLRHGASEESWPALRERLCATSPLKGPT